MQPRGFNFTAAMRDLCHDMASRVPELHHVRMEQVGVGFCQTRRNVSHGMQASLTPLRFAGGEITEVRRKRRYTCPRLFDEQGNEFLYLLNFYLPRFLNQPFGEKLTTVVHELWHIGPRFDGDLRRHAGRCYAHGASQETFDAHAEALSKHWLALSPPECCYAFLQANFSELSMKYGSVFGQRFAGPKLVVCDIA
jgi:hypothetical protein